MSSNYWGFSPSFRIEGTHPRVPPPMAEPLLPRGAGAGGGGCGGRLPTQILSFWGGADSTLAIFFNKNK